MRAAVRSVRQHRPDRVIVAVPVGATEARETLAREADDVVLVYEPVMFWAVGQFYQDFRQLDDAEVQAILRRYRRERETAGA
jgi:putative phosphoribosyl transferase